jgi:hypothetical protein
MAGLDDSGTELLIVRDIQLSLIIEESIEFFPFDKVVNQSARIFLAKYFEGLSNFDFAIGAVSNLLFKCRRLGEGSGSKHNKAFKV